MMENLHFFEQPICENWIYPCTLEEVKQQLIRLPSQDLEGLWAVGLAASTRKDNNAYGRYLFDNKPSISLFSYPASYCFKLMAHTKRHGIERVLAAELDYGMQFEQVGSRFVCSWKPEDLRRFMLFHVVAHEVGHHVYYRQRQQQRFVPCKNSVESEQFAEAYAKRMASFLSMNGNR